MDIKIEIDKDAVQAQVVSAVIKSAIGEAIEKAITAALAKTDRSYSYNSRSIVDDAVSSVVSDIVRREVQAVMESKRDAVRARIVELATDDVVDAWIKKSWDVVNRP